jgi:thiol-disulfide isomerase/thioredoxin
LALLKAPREERHIRQELVMKTLIALISLIAAPAFAEIKAGDKPIDFEKTTNAGKSLKLSSLKGKVVLLDFWASWCEPCKEELPLLSKMAARLRAKGIEIVAVNVDQKKENAEAFLRSHPLDLTVVFDADQKLISGYEPPKMPSSYLIDKSGTVRAVMSGFERGDEAKLEAKLVGASR